MSELDCVLPLRCPLCGAQMRLIGLTHPSPGREHDPGASGRAHRPTRTGPRTRPPAVGPGGRTRGPLGSRPSTGARVRVRPAPELVAARTFPSWYCRAPQRAPRPLPLCPARADRTRPPTCLRAPPPADYPKLPSRELLEPRPTASGSRLSPPGGRDTVQFPICRTKGGDRRDNRPL